MKRILAFACAALFPLIVLADDNPLARGRGEGIGNLVGLGNLANLISSGDDDLTVSMQAHSKIEADATAVANDFQQLRSDVHANNTAAISLDQAKITTDFATLQADETALRTKLMSDPGIQSALAAVVADRQALDKDAVQLRSDEIVGNKTAIAADEAQSNADAMKLSADLKALRLAVEAVTI